MVFPVQTLQPLKVLDGQANGRLSDSILHDTPGQAGGPTVRLVEPAARSWRAMCAAAKRAGHTLKATSLYDSFRPYEVQERIFLERFSPYYIPGRPSRFWRGKWWWLKPGMALAAVPGTSNHGWGRAVDTGEERDGDTGTESVDAGTLDWLLANEERFGFSHEVQSEPWHIRYFAGDVPPMAVIDYERSLRPTEDDDLTPAQAEQLNAVALLAVSISDRLARVEEKVAHLDPFRPEKHDGNADPSTTGVASAKQNRWISETVRRLRAAHIGDDYRT